MEENRRPLKVRGLKIMRDMASFLASKNISPNQISIASIFFAVLTAYFLANSASSLKIMYVFLAAICIQCRLLCNLFDGMVAVEGGKKSASGELFNDVPDRISDPIIFIGMGYAISSISGAIELGWCAGLLSIFTAYARTLASSINAPTNFCGPMAKQHRMALATFACLLTIIETIIGYNGEIFYYTLWLIIIGCIVTVARRLFKAYLYLEGKE